MSYNGKFLHFSDNEEFIFLDIKNMNLDKIIDIPCESYVDIINKNTDDSFILRENDEFSFSAHVNTLGNINIKYKYSERTYLLTNKDNKYLCCDGNGSGFNKNDPYLWEQFILVSEKFVSNLNYIMSNKWICKRDGKLYNNSDIKIDEIFSIAIGPYSLDLRRLQDTDVNKYSLIGIVDCWSPEKFLLYKPVIYITAYSSDDVMKQLGLCVESIRKIGKFYGKIVVMTDKSLEEIHDICHEFDENSIEIDTIHPKDFVGFVCSKYNILDKKNYIGYQPVLYLDPDIIFDNTIEPMLVDAVCSEKICAPIETFNRLMTHPPIGAQLIQLDSLNIDIYCGGFNGGTISFPNIEDQNVQKFISLVRKTIANIGIKFGRNFNGWADQEVLNFIAYKFGGMDGSYFTKYAKYVEVDINKNYSRSGFVHFVGRPSKEKVYKMKKYLKNLLLSDNQLTDNKNLENC
nr:hypothetical protein [Acetobacter persici]